MAETKRQYLVRMGLAREGRGRMSNAAKEAIKAAVNKGVQFSDGSEAKNVAGIGGETKAPRQDRPNGMYTFENPDGSTFKRCEAEACSRCQYSLPWCYCPDGPAMFPYPHVMGQEGMAVMIGRPSVSATPEKAEKPTPRRGGGGTRRGRPRATQRSAA